MNESARKVDVTDIEHCLENSHICNGTYESQTCTGCGSHFSRLPPGASICMCCKQPFQPGAAVWQDLTCIGSRHCDYCAQAWGNGKRFQRPCEHCKRPVFYGLASTYNGNSYRSHWFRVLCTKHCQNAFYRKTKFSIDRYYGKRVPSQHALLFTCLTCNQPFAPTRAYAKHCSSACRQKAYRQRLKRPNSYPVGLNSRGAAKISEQKLQTI